MSIYRIELTPDDNGTFLVTCPVLPEVTTFAENRAMAQAVARPAIEEALAARIARGEDAPAQSDIPWSELGSNECGVVMPLLTSLKVDLYNTMRAKGVTKAELSRRLRQHPPQIDRLLKIDHQSQLEAVAEAFRAMEYDVRIEVAPRSAA
ncbi:MAG TPA: hypothetical protein VG960_05765 [Caulobacteraceae bacterium]|nr:hypothetical protein [Caulobacteraceae bacterium]